jgi:hypothetical protein
VTDRHLVTIEVAARPATFATAYERPWKEAVRAAIAATGVKPQNARFAVLEHPEFHAHLVLCDAASPGGSAVMRLPDPVPGPAFV